MGEKNERRKEKAKREIVEGTFPPGSEQTKIDNNAQWDQIVKDLSTKYSFENVISKIIHISSYGTFECLLNEFTATCIKYNYI